MINDIKPLHVELGSGEKIPRGRLRSAEDILYIDARPLLGVDLVYDLSLGIPLEDNSVFTIFSCHFLEHLSYDSVIGHILPDAFRILRPGGRFTTQMPDFDRIVTVWNNRCDCVDYETWQVDPLCIHCGGKAVIGPQRLREYLFGGQDHAFDLHRYVWGFKDFKDILLKTGFLSVENKDPLDSPIDMYVTAIKG